MSAWDRKRIGTSGAPGISTRTTADQRARPIGAVEERRGAEAVVEVGGAAKRLRDRVGRRERNDRRRQEPGPDEPEPEQRRCRVARERAQGGGGVAGVMDVPAVGMQRGRACDDDEHADDRRSARRR